MPASLAPPALQAVEKGDGAAAAKSKAAEERSAIDANVDALFEESEGDEDYVPGQVCVWLAVGGWVSGWDSEAWHRRHQQRHTRHQQRHHQHSTTSRVLIQSANLAVFAIMFSATDALLRCCSPAI